jgi:hypothetical protein
MGVLLQLPVKIASDCELQVLSDGKHIIKKQIVHQAATPWNINRLDLSAAQPKRCQEGPS